MDERGKDGRGVETGERGGRQERGGGERPERGGGERQERGGGE